MPCNVDAILDIGRRYSLPVAEDAACAIGSEVRRDGRPGEDSKPHGDVACFSFHPRKIISTGDGGMITTSVSEWDHQFRLRRQHSMSVPDAVGHGARDITFRILPRTSVQRRIVCSYREAAIRMACGRAVLVLEVVSAPRAVVNDSVIARLRRTEPSSCRCSRRRVSDSRIRFARRSVSELESDGWTP